MSDLNSVLRSQCGLAGEEAADYIESQDEKIQTLEHQIRSAKTIIKGLEARLIARSREYEPLVQRAADTDGQREVNTILTNENEAQAEKIRVLRDELTEVLEWAVRERAPLRDQEITSIRSALEKTK